MQYSWIRLAVLLTVLFTISWIPLQAQQSSVIQQARQHLVDNGDRFGVPAGTAHTARISSSHTSNVSGITYVYFKQTVDGIDVNGGDITMALKADGSLFYVSGQFSRAAAEASGASASLDVVGAVEAVSRHLGYIPDEPFQVLERAVDLASPSILSTAGIAEEPVLARQVFEPVMDGKEYRLAWEVIFNEPDSKNLWSIQLDANSGEILSRHNWVLECSFGEHEDLAEIDHSAHEHFLREAPETISLATPSSMLETAAESRGGDGTYRVYADPTETPSHGERELVTNPADPVASPYGWHTTTPGSTPTYTITRGNNTHAYADANGQNQPSGANNTPDGGDDLLFDYPVDLTQHPSNYRLAAVTNLFYTVNRVHDILYHHGFDEASGNFQTVNYSGAPGGGDYIRAEAQDGSGMNNAYFWYSPEGSPARIEMFLWSQTSPQRDGDFDNGIIGHEYGHGWSLRLTGGRLNNNCLNNSEQMGEGWSDFMGLVMTMRPGDTGVTRRGVGTYVLGQPTTGNGIRPAPYTTNMSENSYTYGNIGNLAVPHGVGFLWNTMLWEMTWNLVDRYGFSEDLINGNGGNNIALTLVSEGMKLQPCSPGFVDGRDAILAADEALYDGAHKLEIWTAFAKRGLGYSASQGSAGSTSDGTEAFDLPPELFSFSLDPDSLDFYLTLNGTNSAELEIVNEGIMPLEWEVLEGEIATDTYDPTLDEELDVPDFTVHPSANATFSIPAGITSSGNVTGFTFEGTVVMQGSSDWASDMRLVITSPAGQSFNVGGFSNVVNSWDFQGGGSSSNGTYSSTHLDIFGQGGTPDDGDWSLVFSHGWSSGNDMNWSDVSITLHKLLEIECGASWLTMTPGTGSTDPEQTSTLTVLANAEGLTPDEYVATLCVTSGPPVNTIITVPVTLTIEDIVGYAHTVGASGDGAGWQMMVAPTDIATVQDMADVNLVYGIPGEYENVDTANFHVGYDGHEFVAPSGLDNPLVPGKGFIWYLWDTEYENGYTPGADGTSEHQQLPFNLVFQGVPVAFENYQVEFSADERSNVSDDGFFMLGNPYVGNYNVGGIVSEGGEEVSNWFWHWDPVANAYQQLDASRGDQASPVMGFFAEFVEAPDNFPVAVSFGPTPEERGVTEYFGARFELTGEMTVDSETYDVFDPNVMVIFSDDASDGRDRLDAGKLTPLSEYWVNIAVIGMEGDELIPRAVESRATPLEIVTMPLAISTRAANQDAGGTFTISLADNSFPDGWRVKLTDLDTGDVVDMLTDSHTFTIETQSAIDNDQRFELMFTPPSVGTDGTAENFVFGLEPVWPNPSTSAAQVAFTLETAGDVSVDVFDVLGRRIARVVDGEYGAGRHVLPINNQQLASGVYVIRLTSGAQSAVQRFTVAR